MIVFTPMPDEALLDSEPVRGRLVPFSTDFLVAEQAKDTGCPPPRHWIGNSDYHAACERLRANQQASVLATA